MSGSTALLEEPSDGDGGELAGKIAESRAKVSKHLAALRSQ